MRHTEVNLMDAVYAVVLLESSVEGGSWEVNAGNFFPLLRLDYIKSLQMFKPDFYLLRHQSYCLCTEVFSVQMSEGLHIDINQ